MPQHAGAEAGEIVADLLELAVHGLEPPIDRGEALIDRLGALGEQGDGLLMLGGDMWLTTSDDRPR